MQINESEKSHVPVQLKHRRDHIRTIIKRTWSKNINHTNKKVAHNYEHEITNITRTHKQK